MNRRHFARLLATLTLLLTPVGRWCRGAWAQVRRRLLPATTPLDTLIYEDPAELDARQLPVTPVEKFGIEGMSDHVVDPASWRLRIGGAVARPFQLDHAGILALPPVERAVLLICPGTFAYHARWRGFAIGPLLRRAGLDPRVTQVEVSGPEGDDRHNRRFTLAEIDAETVFLAHSVNDRPLPRPHGFPLRTVAEGHVGAAWIKYVDHITAILDGPNADTATPAPRTPTQGPAYLP